MNERDIFLEALDKPGAAERAAYLDAACGGDAGLRQRVEKLLAAHEAAGGILDRPAATEEPTGSYQPPEPLGTRIGPYKLLQLLGEGGMGAVYLAEQQEPVRRRVALKVIKAGMDSRQVLARFGAERQALALMDHPNIARVLDAGTTPAPSPLGGEGGGEGEGQPYFVMELVKGIPITRYCDQEHLTPRERLELFIPVCHAIQHAHQKGIIHRDLKPSNVIVALYDGRPVPKVIDFGVAKATAQRLTERTMFTEVGQMVGTLEYMSPEQAELNNLDIDTRSDIYSLGVLLYELLTGSPPFTARQLRAVAFTEMLRMIREVEPPRPSTKLSSSEELPSIAARRRLEPGRLCRLVHGDLDWVVMKCLEKDRSRRYETATQLGLELRRYLADEPVAAGPPGAGYRLRKFARRNRGPVLAAALVALALVGGVIGTSWGLVRAVRAEGVADERREAAEEAERQARGDRDTAERERGRAAESAKQARAALTRAEATLYFNRITLAHQYWLGNQVVQTQRLLDACPPEMRHWEWHYLKRLDRWEMLKLPGNQAAFSPDGTRLATNGPGKTVRVWDAQTGREIATLHGDAAFGRLAFSPDGQFLAAACRDRTARVWEVRTGRPALTLRGHRGGVRDVAFSPDGRLIATAGVKGALRGDAMPDELKVWDARTGRELLNVPEAGHDVAFSPDGRRLATAGEKGRGHFHDDPAPCLLILDVQTGEVLLRIRGHGSSIHKSITFSPDGTFLASIHAGAVRLWDAATGQEIRALQGHSDRIDSVAISPDGRRVASGGKDDRTVKVWDAASGEELFTYRGHSERVQCVRFSPDGRYLASGGEDATVRVWDATKDQAASAIPAASFGSYARSVAVSPDGKYVAMLPALMVHPVGTPLALSAASTLLNPYVAFLDRSSLLILIDARTGRHVRTFCTYRADRYLPGFPGTASRLIFSPDGSRLAAANGDTVQVWEVTTGQEIAQFPGHNQNLLAFSSDGQRLAFSGEGRTVEVWDLASRRRLCSFGNHTGPVMDVTFSPDGTRVATGGVGKPQPDGKLRQPGEAKVWDAGTGREILDLPTHPLHVAAVAFSPDGKCLVTGSWDRTVRVWDLATGREKLSLGGHTAYVWDVGFSGDGTRLATAGIGGVKLWDWPSGQEILSLPSDAPVLGVAFVANGQRLAATSSLGVTIWDGTPVDERSDRVPGGRE